jgi:hypothetical protein
LVILVTAAKFGARYEIYGHEYFARRAGLAEHKIATIAAGERPGNLTREEDRLSGRVLFDGRDHAQRVRCLGARTATSFDALGAHSIRLGSMTACHGVSTWLTW